MSPKRLRVTVRGRVQGVFFRASAEQRAHELGLVGWVRNEPDGAVQLVAEGSEEALADFERWCRTGPPGAYVDALDAEWSQPRGDLRSFSIRR